MRLHTVPVRHSLLRGKEYPPRAMKMALDSSVVLKPFETHDVKERGTLHVIRRPKARDIAVCWALTPVVGAPQIHVRYFREEMTARNVYVINKLGWDRRALQDVPSTLREYNSTRGRKYDFPENVCAINKLTVTRIPFRWRLASCES